MDPTAPLSAGTDAVITDDIVAEHRVRTAGKDAATCTRGGDESAGGADDRVIADDIAGQFRIRRIQNVDAAAGTTIDVVDNVIANQTSVRVDHVDAAAFVGVGAVVHDHVEQGEGSQVENAPALAALGVAVADGDSL